MARSGLTKQDVKEAYQSLIARGVNPSIDAVRNALGNTGSKSTIHKYLKEIEQESTEPQNKPTINDAISALIGRLSEKLQSDAAEVIAQEKEKLAQEKLVILNLMNLAKEELVTTKNSLLDSQNKVKSDALTIAAMLSNSQKELIARAALEEQVLGLNSRLVENDNYLKSLEEKNQHARASLEHYRESVKEQREQDGRRHDQQIQLMQSEIHQLKQSINVKQSEATQLNKQCAQLNADLSHTKKTVFDLENQLRKLTEENKTLDSLASQVDPLKLELISKVEQIKAINIGYEEALQKNTEFAIALQKNSESDSIMKNQKMIMDKLEALAVLANPKKII